MSGMNTLSPVRHWEPSVFCSTKSLALDRPLPSVIAPVAVGRRRHLHPRALQQLHRLGAAAQLHAFGPMGLKELTAQKYVVDRDGQVR